MSTFLKLSGGRRETEEVEVDTTQQRGWLCVADRNLALLPSGPRNETIDWMVRPVVRTFGHRRIADRRESPGRVIIADQERFRPYGPIRHPTAKVVHLSFGQRLRGRHSQIVVIVANGMNQQTLVRLARNRRWSRCTPSGSAPRESTRSPSFVSSPP